MQAKAAVLDPERLKAQTSIYLSRVNHALETARRITEDPERRKRLKEQQCKSCWYFPAIGGQAITTRPCASCSEEITWGNTVCPVLCIPCAKSVKLCRKCGSDINLNPKRRKWPTFGKPETNGSEPDSGTGTVEPAQVFLLPKRSGDDGGK